MPSKCVLILLDGLGDRSYACLGHQTPLAAAHTPALDAIAAQGATGLYHAMRPGVALPSEIAHFAIFGYEPAVFPGRGPLEAIGSGIELEEGDVAVLAHFASVRREGSNLRLVEDVPVLQEAEATELFEAVRSFEREGVRIELHQTHKGFGVLRLQGSVSPWVTDTGTMRAGRLLSEPLALAEHAGDARSLHTARVLKAYLCMAHNRLRGLDLNRSRAEQGLVPINAVVTQRAGMLGAARPFRDLNGLEGKVLADGAMFQGLARYVGLAFEPMDSGLDPEREIAQRLDRARQLLTAYDFVHVHTKAPDKASHAKDPVMKKTVIEALDRGLGAAAAPLLDDPDVLVVVTADHSTPSCGELIHSGDTVPVVFWGRGVRRDAVAHFNEVSAAMGSLGCLRGEELMLMILDHLDRSRMEGIRDTPMKANFWPGRYQAFTLEEHDDPHDV